MIRPMHSSGPKSLSISRKLMRTGFYRAVGWYKRSDNNRPITFSDQATSDYMDEITKVVL
jgi:hypothetical protein